ncbi:MAG: hypothetical protein WA347_05040 [Rhabdochlamydiaceae bacterium]
MKYVKAEEGPKNSVIYFDEEGNKLVRHWKRYEDEPVDQASTRSWRNNNPGNHVLGPFARKNGAIGGAGRIPNKENKDLKFAIYPDYVTGRKAQAKRLKEGTMYIDLTLNSFVRKYTGVKAGEPDTQEVINYRKAIRFFTKFDMERTIRSLNDEEYEKLLDAMKRHEGWREGKEEYIKVKKVLGIHVNKKRVIFEFLVADSGASTWISKQEAIALAEDGRLHAIIVHGKNGTYLRPEYYRTRFKDMICMIVIEDLAIV